jgi:hypothetical protein
MRPKLMKAGVFREVFAAPVAVPAEAPSTYSDRAPVVLVRVKTTWCQAPLL